jgi:excisionase family DNA binding protein
VPTDRAFEAGGRLLNVKDAARFLGTTPKTLYTMVWRREIVFVKIGRSVRFDVRDLEEMIECAKVRPTEEIARLARLKGDRSSGAL